MGGWDDGVSVRSGPVVIAPGEPAWLEFHCSALEEPDADYDIFVRFLAPDGHFVNGTNGPPQFGAALTSGWRLGETQVARGFPKKAGLSSLWSLSTDDSRRALAR